MSLEVIRLLMRGRHLSGRSMVLAMPTMTRRAFTLDGHSNRLYSTVCFGVVCITKHRYCIASHGKPLVGATFVFCFLRGEDDVGDEISDAFLHGSTINHYLVFSSSSSSSEVRIDSI